MSGEGRTRGDSVVSDDQHSDAPPRPDDSALSIPFEFDLGRALGNSSGAGSAGAPQGAVRPIEGDAPVGAGTFVAPSTGVTPPADLEPPVVHGGARPGAAAPPPLAPPVSVTTSPVDVDEDATNPPEAAHDALEPLPRRRRKGADPADQPARKPPVDAHPPAIGHDPQAVAARGAPAQDVPPPAHDAGTAGEEVRPADWIPRDIGIIWPDGSHGQLQVAEGQPVEPDDDYYHGTPGPFPGSGGPTSEVHGRGASTPSYPAPHKTRVTGSHRPQARDDSGHRPVSPLPDSESMDAARAFALRRAAPRRSVFDRTALGSSTGGGSRPGIPASLARGLPSLPASNPVPILTSDFSEAPSILDIHAVRSFQLRAQRDSRRGKLFGRSFFAVALIGAFVVSALVFGRTYLFPDQWNAELTPIVDQIQIAEGVEFSDVVPLTVLPADEYTAVALDVVVGPGWTDRLPAWRALGVASGSAMSDAIADAVISWRPAIYDPATGTVYRAAGADPSDLEDAYRLALAEIFQRQYASPPQRNTGDASNVVLGVSPTGTINSRAIDRVLLDVDTGDAWSIVERRAPLPLLFEFAAVDRFGAHLLEAGGGFSQRVVYGDIYPDRLLAATEIPSSLASPGSLPAEATAVGDPIALGADAWVLVWRNRLPAASTARLESIVVGDAYQAMESGGARCFLATFATGSGIDGDEAAALLQQWASVSPSEAGAVVTRTSPTTIDLIACDPGADSDQAVDPAAVKTVLERQIIRLGG